LKQEVLARHDLSPDESTEINERIEYSVEMCEHEMKLLASASTLAELTDEEIRHLLDIHDHGSVQPHLYNGGMSPMHHAVKSNRRDVIEYILSHEGGRILLEQRDKKGRTPLYYAKSKAIEHWLLEEVGHTAPMHQQTRPNVEGIPDQYMNLLTQIENSGWHTVNWKNNYTMLHWAASKGNGDLCSYLISLDADPNLRENKQDRTPLDIAKFHGHDQVVRALDESAKRRLQSVVGATAFSPGSASARMSQLLGKG